MTYIALARTWRPKTFSELVGQEHVCTVLMNALIQQRLHHAYIFTGTRGVGKTSIARILAKALNCEQGVSATPCLQCDTCQAIDQGRFIDLLEIDGASRTRVEDTRELLDNVPYAPSYGRFKIYLIDEVHMLSQHSFNALLKTLEEPPAHVKFLLATTDPQKLPVTVLSRCIQFHLKPVPSETINKHLISILEKEQQHFEPEAVALIAHAAQGSIRDGLSILEQAIAYCNQQITVSGVKNCLGYTQKDFALFVLQAFANHSPHELLATSRHIAEEGGNFHYVLEQILSYLHQICMEHTVPGALKLPAELLDLSKHLQREDAHLFYKIGLKGMEELHLAPTPAIGFDMLLLRMYAFMPLREISSPPLLHEIISSGRPLGDVDNSSPTSAISTFCASSTESMVTVDNPAHKLSEEGVKSEMNAPLPLIPASSTQPVVSISSDQSPKDEENCTWEHIIPKLQLTGLALTAVTHAQGIKESPNAWLLRVDKRHASLFTPSVITRIEQALTHYANVVVKLTISCEEETPSSPAQQQKIMEQNKQAHAKNVLQSDPFFQQLQTEFSAEVLTDAFALQEKK